MPSKCCVVGCNGNYDLGPKVHVFSFPKNDDLRLKWISAIQRKGFTPTRHSKVCEQHFKENEILNEATAFDEKTGRTISAPLARVRLSPNAVPSRFIVPDARALRRKQRRWRVKINNDTLSKRRRPMTWQHRKKVNTALKDCTLEDTSSGLPIITSVRSCCNEKWLHSEENATATNFDEKSNRDEMVAGAFTWKHDSVQLLVEHFRCYKDLFKSGYMGNKATWWRIALSMQKQGCPVTADMCEEKWHALFLTYKEHIENNGVISYAAKRWEYYQDFHELYWKEVVSMLNSQTKEMLNAAVQTVSKSNYCSTAECETICSSTSSSVLPCSGCNISSSNSALGKDDSLLQFLKEKHHSDIQWQLQMKELVLRNLEVQDKSNKVLNKLTEILIAYIQKH